MRNIRFVLAATLLLACLAPVATYADGPTIDGPTQTALDALRTNAAKMVTSMSNNKGITGDQVTASYNDQLKDMSSQRLNSVMIVKSKAEHAAWTQMDPTSRALVKSFFAAGR